MSDEVYRKLAQVLDTLPNGFPSTESGIEIRILKKIFDPDEAELFCHMRMAFETAEQISKRTGMPIEGLERKLIAMGRKGQLLTVNLGGTWIFRMMPWIFGIFEFQLGRLDRELAEMGEEYGPAFWKQFASVGPQLMRTVPIEETITANQETLPYERVSALIEQSRSFLLNECICKKEHELLGKPCSRPKEVCLAMAPVPGAFDRSPVGRPISKEEAYAVLKMAEEQGLVHLTSNVQNGMFYICNCCKCCCGPLRAINDLGFPAGEVLNSLHYAVIDPDLCTNCGLCREERCQVDAIIEENDASLVVREKCIGCGLCVTTCPAGAVRLVAKPARERLTPPVTENDWFDERGSRRGVDFSRFK